MTGREEYFEKLRRDMLEQFKDKPNVEVYQKALTRQLDDLHTFFDELNTLRWLKTAEGVQLDGIGDIVVLSRSEALAIAKLADQNVPMNDDFYRLYLTWKIALNTSNCTHSDRHKALRLFWDKTPLFYSEDPMHPATIFISVPEVIRDADAAVFRIASLIKAAGVALHFLFPNDGYTVTDYTGGAVNDVIAEFITEEVEICTEATSYSAGAIAEKIDEFIVEGVEIDTEAVSYEAGAIYELIKELIVEYADPETVSYEAGAIFEKVDESYFEGVEDDTWAMSYDARAIFETIKEAYEENG